MAWIISLISGAIGGILAGNLIPKFSLGTLWNAIVGILGGGIGSYLLGLLGVNIGGGGMDLMGIIGMIVEGGIGGGVLMVIVGLLKGLFK